MEDRCKEMNTIDDSSLLETDEDDKKYKRANKNTYKKHYSLTKKQIDKQNKHILNTQATCMRFVKKYRGLPRVCNWCKKAPAPKIIWKWSYQEKVWYRWYDNKWHYWGPSKRGFTALGWTWYKGYWHHNGYVYKFVKGMWFRFQGLRWVRYGKRVPINPKRPRGKPICRPFYKLMKAGFPASLAVRKLPRCKVGSGKKSTIYMWKNRAACRFIGGRLVYTRMYKCKTGRQHQWKRVTKCILGPILTNKGLNYKTGQAWIQSRHKANGRQVKPHDHEKIEILVESDKTLELGFPGKKVNGQKVLQIEKVKKGNSDAVFYLHKAYHGKKGKSGKYKLLYTISKSSNRKTVLDVVGKKWGAGAFLTASRLIKKRPTQVWQLQHDKENRETVISDPSGKWCVTRLEKMVDRKPTHHTQLELVQTAPVFSTDIKLTKCEDSANQYWFIKKLK